MSNKKVKNTEFNYDNIPIDVWKLISSFLMVEDFAALSITSKEFYHRLWKDNDMWKTLYLKSFDNNTDGKSVVWIIDDPMLFFKKR